MKKAIVTAWVEGYIRAWETNAPKDIARLFAKNAEYYTTPFGKPWRGWDGIVREWLAHHDEPGDYEFRYEVVGTGADSGIVRGWTTYKHPPREYSNIWLIRFDDAGRCREFTEWWKERSNRGA